MPRKVIYFIIALFMILSVVLLSYNLSYKKYNLSRYLVNNPSNKASSEDKTVSTVSDNIISLNAKLKFYSLDVNNKRTLELELEAGEFAGKTNKDIENIFSNSWYKVNSISNSEIILLKKQVSNILNKYILGIEEGNLALYKCDSNGKTTLIHRSKRNVQSLTEKSGHKEFINDLVLCKLQYDTLDKAEESLGDFE